MSFLSSFTISRKNGYIYSFNTKIKAAFILRFIMYLAIVSSPKRLDVGKSNFVGA